VRVERTRATFFSYSKQDHPDVSSGSGHVNAPVATALRSSGSG
jgi:hypothetical protein